VSCIDEVVEFGPAFSANERTRAFLKVQDGCDYSCSFCTIPMARGRSRSATPDSLVAQATGIAALGFREIVLSGVNVGLYGQEFGVDLLHLLRLLDEVEGIDRYRISSIEPNLLTDDIVQFVSKSKRFVPHFHVPLQSGSDRVLAGMRRRYRRDVYRRRMERILESMPDACLGADVIVGFPGESENLFQETAAFLADLPLAYLHVFTYSERPGTVAVERTADGTLEAVPAEERSRRNRILRRLSTRKRRAFYEGFKNSRRSVLWEPGDNAHSLVGFTDNYIRVRGSADQREVGDIEEVLLGQIGADGLMEIQEHLFLPTLEAIRL
jgi:threonylcarbamoyladenosine tRNA methylthiotransferase MtaB